MKWEVSATVKVNMGGNRKAAKAFETLKPEVQTRMSRRTMERLRREGSTLFLRVEALDVTALRASLNSFCRWLSIVNAISELADKIPR